MPVASPHSLRQAFETRDADVLAAALAPDVVLHSPIISTPFEGRESVLELFEALLQTLEDVTYTDEVAGDESHVLVWRAMVGRVPIEGIDILRFDDEGRITDFTVLVRPQHGLSSFARALGPRLARRRGRGRALVARLGLRPLAAMAFLADRISPRLVKQRS